MTDEQKDDLKVILKRRDNTIYQMTRWIKELGEVIGDEPDASSVLDDGYDCEDSELNQLKEMRNRLKSMLKGRLLKRHLDRGF